METIFKPTILLDPSKVNELDEGAIALDVTNKRILFKKDGTVDAYSLSETKVNEIINNNTTVTNLTNAINEVRDNSITETRIHEIINNNATITQLTNNITHIQENPYVHPTGDGNYHLPAGGIAGQLLSALGNGAAEWKTINMGGGITSSYAYLCSGSGLKIMYLGSNLNYWQADGEENYPIVPGNSNGKTYKFVWGLTYGLDGIAFPIALTSHWFCYWSIKTILQIRNEAHGIYNYIFMTGNGTGWAKPILYTNVSSAPNCDFSIYIVGY